MYIHLKTLFIKGTHQEGTGIVNRRLEVFFMDTGSRLGAVGEVQRLTNDTRTLGRISCSTKGVNILLPLPIPLFSIILQQLSVRWGESEFKYSATRLLDTFGGVDVLCGESNVCPFK